MTRPICLQVYISSELSSLIRKAAKAKGISMSEWVRALLANACTEDELASRLDASIERISRRSVFLMVGVDALLAGHPDHALRESGAPGLCAQMQGARARHAAGEGGSDEA
jgi:LmbE family N-acetylglucosaminyl deacetylase